MLGGAWKVEIDHNRSARTRREESEQCDDAQEGRWMDEWREGVEMLAGRRRESEGNEEQEECERKEGFEGGGWATLAGVCAFLVEPSLGQTVVGGGAYSKHRRSPRLANKKAARISSGIL